MADNALGKILEIDEKTIDDITNLGDAIVDIGVKAEDAAEKFNKAFASMTGSVNGLKDGLTSLQMLIDSIDATKINEGVAGINAMSETSSSAASSVSEAASALGQFAQASEIGAENAAKFSEAMEGVKEGAPMKAAAKSVEDLMKEYQELLEYINLIKEDRSFEQQALAHYRYDSDLYKQTKEHIKSLSKEIKDLSKDVEKTNGKINEFKTAADIKSNKGYFKDYIDGLNGVSLAALQYKQTMSEMAAFYKQQDRDNIAAIKAAQEEQKAYSNLEAQLIRIKQLKQDAETKGFNSSAATKEQAEHYRNILTMEEKITAKMDEMRKKNSGLTENSEKLLRAKEKELAVSQRLTAAQMEEYRQTKKGAMEYANSAKTFNERARAIKYVEAAMKNLNTESTTYKKDLQDLTVKHRELKSAQQEVQNSMKGMQTIAGKLTNTASQLKNALLAAFSIHAISGYIKKLTEVRGEFELQNVALRAILQNRSEADQLFEKVTQLAVKSPFTVRQLVTYTKQLAAYQVESEKLYDTTKKLADVSAGLGVDMNRLILAYGQVKAANYLRATEVRQFTEAGINLLGELAKYYTELEGRMVSVGDVQERVTKRMVEFGDVEQVFTRLTAAGGIFYDMQEKQAETLKGMMSNLQDSIDIMLNQIGISNEDTIKGIIRTLKSLTDNWKEVVYYIKQLGVMFVAWQTAVNAARIGTLLFSDTNMKLASSILKVKNMTATEIATMKISEASTWGLSKSKLALAKAARTAELAVKGLGVALAGIGVGAVIIGIERLIRKATQARREMKAMYAEQDRILREDTKQLKENIDGYANLVNKLKNVNEGSQEHKNIVSQLNSAYGDYLPFLVDENTTYQQLASSIESVNAALTKKAQLASAERLIATLADNAEKQLYELEKAISKGSVSFQNSSNPFDMSNFQFDQHTDEMNLFFAKFRKQVAEMGRALNSSEIQNLFEEVFQPDETQNTMSYTYDIVNKLIDYGKILAKEAQDELNIQERINGAYNNRYSTIERIRAARAAEQQRDVDLESAKRTLDGYALEQKIEEISNAFEKKILELDFAEGLIDEHAYKEKLAQIGKWASETAVTVNQAFKKAAETEGFDMDAISKVWITREKQAKGMTAYEKDIKSSYEQQVAIIEQLERYKKQGLAIDEQSLEKAESQKKLYEIMAGILNIDLTTKNDRKAQKTAEEVARERIALIKKVQQEYKQSLKYMSEEEAKAFTHNAFANDDIYKQLKKMGVIDVDMKLNPEGIISSLERLEKTAVGSAKKHIQAFIAELKNEEIILNIQTNLDSTKVDIEKLFDRLELTKKMKELGLDESLSLQLFGSEALSLDDLEAAIAQMKADFAAANKGIGDDAEKYFISVEDKIRKERMKGYEDMVKDYAKYLKKEFSTAVQIKLEEAKKLAEIESLVAAGKFTKEQGEAAKSGVRKETDKKMDDATWQEFQQSELYLELFENLQNVSTAVLEQMKTKLDAMGSSLKNLSPEALKQVREQITKINDELSDRTPWDNLRTGLAEIKAMKENGQTEASLGLDLQNEQALLDTLNQQKDTIDTVLAARESGQALTQEQLAADAELAKYSEMTSDELHEQANTLNGQITATKANITNTNKLLNVFKKTRTAVDGVRAKWDTILSIVGRLKSSVDEVWDAMGRTEDDESVQTFIDMGLQILELVGAAFLFKAAIDSCIVSSEVLGVTIKTAIPIIGWIMLAVEAIAAILSAIIGNNKKKFEESIKAQQEQVDKLVESYEKLEGAIEDCYNLSDLKSWNAEAEKTLKLAIAQERSMIAQYKARKKGAEKYASEIKELEDAIKDQQKDLEELADNYMEALGGFGSAANLKSAAEDFVDAWVSAFEETGDGLSGLEEQLDEFITNALKKQAMLRVSERFIKPLLDQIDAFADRSKDLSDSQYIAGMTALMERLKQQLPELSAALEPFFAAFKGVKSDSLSGLASGIQGITEDTAEVLASIVESIRFFTASTYTAVQTMLITITAPTEENPWYYQLKRQADATVDIRDMLRKVCSTAGMKNVLQVQIV